jgi:aspartyl-tRNA(Asn)/glutamyl-tRNA(Gln) amidotransferase subunit B
LALQGEQRKNVKARQSFAWSRVVEYESVIGLEVHVELATHSKLFCACPNRFGAPPNSLVCPICMGLPGSLPRINERAVELHVLTALALECSVPALSKFDRKNYFYPDMPKNFQTSQYDQPLASGGKVTISPMHEPERVIQLTRIHLEEDTGKSVHFRRINGELTPDRLASSELSLVDYNRAGVPLMEIVSEPEIRSPDEASAYLQSLRDILVWLGISDCRMEEGSMRCDANVSIRPVGATELGTKTEIKNMNSFKSVRDALEYEIRRQIEAVGKGERIIQETRGWDEARKVTISMRSKEEAHDYRYFPEPDLPPIQIDPQWLQGLREQLQELPRQRARRYADQLGLNAYDANLMVQSRALSDFFEACLAAGGDAKEASNWLANEVARLSQEQGVSLAESQLTPAGLVGLLGQVSAGKLNRPSARQVLEKLFAEGGEADQWIEKLGLVQISGGDELRGLVEQAVAGNPVAVAEFRAGKEKALNSLVGQVMKLTKGRANAAEVTRILKEVLGG